MHLNNESLRKYFSHPKIAMTQNSDLEFVILVNEDDQEIGLMEKMEAHQKAALHRAFSVFLFNSRGEMLLQQRAFSKYHTPGLWSNACCSHPRKSESTLDAAIRRLDEEMGLKCEINEIFSFIYKADVSQGLIEHEVDHVFVGITDLVPVINRNEVESFRYQHPDSLKEEMEAHPERFTAWFKIAFDRTYEYFKTLKF